MTFNERRSNGLASYSVMCVVILLMSVMYNSNGKCNVMKKKMKMVVKVYDE